MTMMFERWIQNRRDWVIVGLSAALFAVLDLLVVLGYEAALYLLVILVGTLLGNFLAYLLSIPIKRPFSRLFGTRRRVAAFWVGLASILAILAFSSYILGAPAIPSEGFRISGALIFGLALGFGGRLRQSLTPASPATPEEYRETRRAEVRLILVVVGTAAALFAITFGVFLLIEYIVAPLIQYVAG